MNLNKLYMIDQSYINTILSKKSYNKNKQMRYILVFEIWIHYLCNLYIYNIRLVM